MSFQKFLLLPLAKSLYSNARVICAKNNPNSSVLSRNVGGLLCGNPFVVKDLVVESFVDHVENIERVIVSVDTEEEDIN